MIKPLQPVYLITTLLLAACYALSFAVAQVEPSPQAEEQSHAGHDHDDHEGHGHDEHEPEGHEDHEGHGHDEHAAEGHEDHEGHGHDEHAAEGHEDHEGHGHDEHAAEGHEDHEGHGHDEHAAKGHEGHDEHGGHGHDDHDESGAIKLDSQVMREFGITVEEAGPGTLNLHTTLPGEVHVNQDHTAHIVPRYPGLVVDVKKHIGDKVRKGDVLAVLEGNESLSRYELKSLLNGTIIMKHITLGESLDVDDAVFTVSNLESVWVDLTVYQKDIPLVQPGQKVNIDAGDHLHTAEGTISYVSPTLDEHTRTSLARVVIPNTEGTWRPGMFVTGTVEVSSKTSSVTVAREAIISIEGNPSIFVQTAEGFEPRTVEIGISDGHRVEILTGLAPGESYASKHVLPLKAEMNRAALEHAGHAH